MVTDSISTEKKQRNTFPKAEHLCKRSAIDNLFERGGKGFLAYPVKVTYKLVEDDQTVRLLIIAQKKRFKHAVDRNKIKRQLREAYRKQKHELVDFVAKNGLHLHIAMMYIDNKILPHYVVERKIKASLDKMIEKLSNKNGEN